MVVMFVMKVLMLMFDALFLIDFLCLNINFISIIVAQLSLTLYVSTIVKAYFVYLLALCANIIALLAHQLKY